MSLQMALFRSFIWLSPGACFNHKALELWSYNLKPCAADWDLNPRGRDANPAKTHSFPTEITHLVSVVNEAQVLDVSSQKEFSERQSDG